MCRLSVFSWRPTNQPIALVENTAFLRKGGSWLSRRSLASFQSRSFPFPYSSLRDMTISQMTEPVFLSSSLVFCLEASSISPWESNTPANFSGFPA